MLEWEKRDGKFFFRHENTMNKEDTENLLKTIDITRKFLQKHTNDPIIDNYQNESLDSQITNIQKRIDLSNKLLKGE